MNMNNIKNSIKVLAYNNDNIDNNNSIKKRTFTNNIIRIMNNAYIHYSNR